MAKLSKRIRAYKEKVDPEKAYPFDEAVGLLKELATAKFNETVEVAVNLGVDARKSDQAVRGATTLPHGTGSDVRVAVFTRGDAAEKAKAAGADLVGMEELAEQIKGGMMDFDVVIPALLDKANYKGDWWAIDLCEWPDAWNATAACKAFVDKFNAKYCK